MGFGKGDDKNIDKQYTKDKDSMVQKQRDKCSHRDCTK